MAHRSSNTQNGGDNGGDIHNLGDIKWIFFKNSCLHSLVLPN